MSRVVASDQVGLTIYTSPPHHPPHLFTSPTTSQTVERRTSERHREEQLCTPHHLATCIAGSTQTYVKQESTTPSPHHFIEYLTDHHLTDHLTDHHRTDHLTTECSSEAAAAWRPQHRCADLACVRLRVRVCVCVCVCVCV